MKIRGHTIWENTDIKLMCRVAGNPAPKVTWYHNKIPIEVSMHGIGKYKITQDNGIHYLEISRAQLCDAGNYRCSAQNYIGEVSDYAASIPSVPAWKFVPNPPGVIRMPFRGLEQHVRQRLTQSDRTKLQMSAHRK